MPALRPDARFAALAVPQFVTAIAAVPLLHVMVPLLSVEGEDHVGSVAWGLFPGYLAAIVGAGLVLFATAPWWTALLVPGLPGDEDADDRALFLPGEGIRRRLGIDLESRAASTSRVKASIPPVVSSESGHRAR